MTSKSDFTTEEWKLVLEAPPSAGMIVVTAQRGGSFRETVAMAKSYVEARQQHGKSELLDDIVAAKPERDHTHYHSADELKTHGLSICVTQWPSSPPRQRRRKSTSTAASSSRCHSTSPRRTASTASR